MAFHTESASRKKARALLIRTGHHLGKLGGHLRDHVGEQMADSDEAADKRLIKKAIREHETQEHGGHHARLHLADGGVADGPMASGRADKASRGHGKGAKNHIAIVIAPQAGQPQARPVPVPVPAPGPHPPMVGGPPPMPPPGMPPGGMLPRPPMGAPPMAGVGPGMPMPGGGPMPMMRKAGGRAAMHGKAESTAADMPWSAPERSEHGPEKMQRRPQEIETAEAQRNDFAPGEERRGGRAHRARGGEVGAGRAAMRAGSGSGEGRLEKSEALPYCGGGRA